MFILFTNLFLARPFRLENTLECYNLRGGQGGSTEVHLTPIVIKRLCPSAHPSPSLIITKRKYGRKARQIEHTNSLLPHTHNIVEPAPKVKLIYLLSILSAKKTIKPILKCLPISALLELGVKGTLE